MKEKNKKGYLLPTLYLLITITIFTGIVFMGSSIFFNNDNYDYSISAIRDTVKPVVGEDTNESSAILSPVLENVMLDVHFYSNNDDAAMQQESLIYYQNTYLPNTGVLYTNNEVFDITSVFSGTIEEISNDEFFGSYIVIKHNDNLKTYYYGLDNIEVKVGNEVTTGTVLGTSRVNDILDGKYSLLLEVYHNGKLIDPEDFIGTKITDYQ